MVKIRVAHCGRVHGMDDWMSMSKLKIAQDDHSVLKSKQL
jgi:hypothetical protein